MGWIWMISGEEHKSVQDMQKTWEKAQTVVFLFMGQTKLEAWWAKKAFGLVDKGRDNNNPTGAKPTNQRGGRSLTSLNSSGCGEGGVSGWLTGQKLEDSREQRAWSQAGQPGWWGSDLGVWRWGSGAGWRDGLERPLRETGSETWCSSAQHTHCEVWKP